jgi:myo-inositol-1(or 4)-monophosphatase
MKSIRDETIEIVRAAGRAIMGYYRGAFDVQDKSPDNPVTDADLAADTLLKTELLALLPEAGWLSEETVDSPDRLAKSTLWVVDPLDGTKEFVMGIPEFSVSVALVQDNRPVLGIIYNPVTAELYVAEKDEGITYNGHPAGVSTTAGLAGAKVVASRSEHKRGEFDPFTNLMEVQIVGSIAYKLAQVAAGQADATWSRGPKHEWDICAGTLLVQEGGGHCVDLDNAKMLFNKSFPKVNGIIADNGRLHDDIVAALTPYGAARKDPR